MITIGKSRSTWVNEGFAEYAKRLSGSIQLNLIELSLTKRTKTANTKQIKELETRKLLKAVPKNNTLIALDEHGQEYSTMDLAKKITTWRQEQRDISLLIGGPDGLALNLLPKPKSIWSLTKLTLPHQLVRIIIAEQIYRAWSITNNHPYHRK